MDVDPQTLAIIIQSGCFGLLAYMVAVGLPRERKEVQEAHERQVESVLTAFKAEQVSHEHEVDKMLQTFQSEMRIEREGTERRHAENCARHEATMESLKSTRHAIKDVHQATVLHHAIIDRALGFTPRQEPRQESATEPAA